MTMKTYQRTTKLEGGATLVQEVNEEDAIADLQSYYEDLKGNVNGRGPIGAMFRFIFLLFMLVSCVVFFPIGTIIGLPILIIWGKRTQKVNEAKKALDQAIK